MTEGSGALLISILAPGSVFQVEIFPLSSSRNKVLISSYVFSVLMDSDLHIKTKTIILNSIFMYL